jgi:hypothetical protein
MQPKARGCDLEQRDLGQIPRRAGDICVCVLDGLRQCRLAFIRDLATRNLYRYVAIGSLSSSFRKRETFCSAQPDGTAWDAQPQPQRTTYMCALKRPDQGLDGRTRSLNYRSEAGSSNRQLRYRDRQRTDYVGQGQVEEFKSRRMFGGRAHPCLAGSHSRRRPLGPHKVAREPSAVRQTAKSPHTRWQRPVLAQHDDCAG